MCEEVFSGHIDFNNVTNLVWYIKTTKHCKVDCPSFLACVANLQNAAVSSGKTFYKFHAVLPSEPPTPKSVQIFSTFHGG